MSRSRADIAVKGDRQIRHLFEELPKRVLRKGLRQAIVAADNPIVAQAKRTARRESGLLRRSIGSKVKAYPSGNVVAVIGARRQVQGVVDGVKRVPANYIHLVEQGTSPHAVPQPKRRRVLRHPGSVGARFLERAFASKQPKAVEIAGRKLAAFVEREALKLGAR